ncbi:MAG: hypothetical protein K6G12_02595 [Lachnospiraceae bacterium]|nr:hypothetical protein [Lachnospiraceae bacterium]
MKLVKNFKGLKKWAKTLFVAMLTICIIFTTTGVGTLYAEADTDGYPTYESYWSTQPSVINPGGVTYDGQEHQLFSLGANRTPYPADLIFHYGYGYEYSTDGVNYSTEGSVSQTAVGTYYLKVTVWYTKINDDNTEGERVELSEVYTNSINAISIETMTMSLTPSSPITYTLDAATTAANTGSYYTLSGLDLGTHYTVSGPDLSSPPVPGDYTVTLTGIGNYTGTLTGTVRVPDVTILFDNSSTQNSSYTNSVTLSVDNYTISYTPDGTYNSSITYTELGTHSFDLYCKASDGTVIKKTVSNLTIESSIPVKYDGSTTKASSYTNKVDITADGYTVGTSSSGPFSTTYTHTTVGAGQVITLYFRNSSTGTVTPVTINDLTIVKADATNGTSTGKITVDTYSSDKLALTTDVVYLTREPKLIQIEASNSAGVSKIEYATATDIYYTISDIEGAVTDGKMKWKNYDGSSCPTIPLNQASYIYARITDANGGYTYLSTGQVIHDNVAPTVSSVSLNKSSSSSSSTSTDNVLVISGSDEVSGVESFYMTYAEKTNNMTTPSAETIISTGQKVEVAVRDGKLVAANANLSGLYSDKTYVFYVVAKDKAGNISAVSQTETKGQGASSSAVSGNSVNKDGSSSGLAAAPNGIAGSGTGNTNAKQTTNASKKTAKAETEEPVAEATGLDREIIRTPYISDATGNTKIGLEATGGWDKIKSEVEKAQDGTTVYIEMSGLSTVPASFFSTLKGKNVTARLEMSDDVEWIIDGANVVTSSGADIDMGVKVGSMNIPNDLLYSVTGSYPHKEIELQHNGALGFDATLRFPIGTNYENKKAYLYYYDTDKKELLLMQSSSISSSGIAEFDFDHASDYTIVIRPDEMLVGTGTTVNAGTAEAEALTAEGSSVTLAEAGSVSTPSTFAVTDMVGQKASVRIWLFAVAIISAALCGFILFMPGFKLQESYDEDDD